MNFEGQRGLGGFPTYEHFYRFPFAISPCVMTQAGKIDTVITENLSCLDRNYLESGAYIEVFFHSAMYAILQSMTVWLPSRAEGFDITPFKNILNEFFQGIFPKNNYIEINKTSSWFA